MRSVLTLVADPAAASLRPSHIAGTREALAAAGMAPGIPDWLATGIACDLAFEGDAAAALGAARAALACAAVDACAQPLEVAAWFLAGSVNRIALLL